MNVAHALLIAVLLAAIAGIAVMAASQARRTRLLGRMAYEAGMRFSRDDIFDVFTRYGDFAIIRAGHSPRANNVTYGQYEGLPVRAFDFRYEIGHGGGRLTRTCGLVLAELEQPLPCSAIWSDVDADAVLEARCPAGRLAGWSLTGESHLARKLCEACIAAGVEGVSMQTSGNRMMLITPLLKTRQDYARCFGLLSSAARLAMAGSTAAVA